VPAHAGASANGGFTVTVLKRALMVAMSLLAVIVMLPSSAQAASGRIRICTESPNPYTSTTVKLENNYTGSLYNETIAQTSASVRCRGEGTSYNYTSEPEMFHVSPGYCATWQANNGPWFAQSRGGSTGVWVSVHPGEGFTRDWLVDVREWDC
jgi:hypothetical protein